MQSLYFAYGSNLSADRMLERVPSAVARAAARLPGWRLTTDKRGRDGSGKANLRQDARGEVWGAVYAIADEHWRALDAREAGYARITVEVISSANERLRVFTYVSERLTRDPVPFGWYKRLVVDGARRHGLPRAWLDFLEALPEREDSGLS